MTLLDIVSKVSGSDRISVVKRDSEEFLIDAGSVEDILNSEHFHKELAGLEVLGLSVGVFCELVISV
jgi:hypothetical protein